MSKLHLLLDTLIADDSGQDLIEYALVAGLVGLVATAGIPAVTTAISAVFSAITTKLNTAAGVTPG